ncbi:hypothetical protein ABIA32_003934 [Streptacidiphilus sp. MAP12-20]|uniref:FG-GAP repeat domain-containing protein n=1 Tax=Streptacidiphilus sp. MAP12-20 TaxID=3156299 RepID=UPI003513D34C
MISAVAAMTAVSVAGTGPSAAASVTPTTARDLLDIPPVDDGPITPTRGLQDGATGALFVADSQTPAVYSWLDYASGAVTPVSLPGTVDGTVHADGDQIGLWDRTASVLRVGDPRSGPWTAYQLPPNTDPVAVHGTEVLVGAANQVYALLSYDSAGTATPVPLRGVPGNAQSFSISGAPAGLAVGFLTPDGVTHWGVADWATATYHELTSAPNDYPNGVYITGDHVAVFELDHSVKGGGDKALIYPVDKALAGVPVTPQRPSADLPYIASVQVIGNHLLFPDYNQLKDLPLTGGAPTVLDGNADLWLFGSGENLFMASSAPNDTWRNQYTVKEYTATPDGGLTSHVVYAPAVPKSHVTALWMRNGELSLSRQWASTAAFSVTPGSDYVFPPTGNLAPGWTLPPARSSLPAGTLVQVDAWGKPVRTVNTGSGCTPKDFQTSQHWIYWNCGAAAPSGVYDLDSGRSIPLPSRAPYLSRVGDGYLINQDLTTGQLLLTDFHSGTAAAPVAIATATLYDGTPDVSWTVDPQSGYLAYEGSGDDRDVHVIDPGVPHSAVTASLSSQYSGGSGPVPMSVAVSQPIDAWQASVVRRSTGQTVAKLSGGAAHASFTATWNGRLPNGQFAFNGDYVWSVSVLPHGGSAFHPTDTTTVTVRNSVVDRHVFGDDDRPDLLAMRTGRGGSTWWDRYNGRLVPEKAAFCRIPGSTAAILPYRTLIPIGHQAAGWANDLLAVDAAGNLWWYPEVNASLSCPETSFAYSVGSGWGGFTSIVSPGDLNGDGHDDLLARDRNGVLWFFPGLGKGKFGPKVRLGGGWNGYTHLIGAGDLTGDGHGNLLAVDASGSMWRYEANGHGGLAPRAWIGRGWGGYNTFVGIGDFNQNGTYDLLARDRNGVLWFLDGTGHGNFRARTEVSAGWGADWGLF